MRLWPALLLLAPLVLSGCLDPFRVRVDDDVLDQSRLDWQVHVGDLEKGGFLGARSIETRYTHDPDDTPPYPGVLQVFSIREARRTSTEDLLERTERVVTQALMANNITLDRSQDEEGQRTLDNGVSTTWFMREGTVRRDGRLFDEESKVRVLGEVGHDGKSSTSFVAVGLAQVTEIDRSPILGQIRETTDLRTWLEIAGDPDGSVAGAVHQNALVHHLRTHG